MMCQRIHDICKICKLPKSRNFKECTERAVLESPPLKHEVTNVFTKRQVICRQCLDREREVVRLMNCGHMSLPPILRRYLVSILNCHQIKNLNNNLRIFKVLTNKL